MNKTYLPTSYLLSVLKTQVFKLKFVLYMRHDNFISLKCFFSFFRCRHFARLLTPVRLGYNLFKLIVLRTCVSLLRVEYIRHMFIQTRFTGHQNPTNCLIKGLYLITLYCKTTHFWDHDIEKIFEKSHCYDDIEMIIIYQICFSFSFFRLLFLRSLLK